MRKTLPAIAAALLLAGLPLRPAFSQSSASLSAGSRYHVDHTAFEALPFTGNFSLAGAYAWHEEAGFWQLALDYVPPSPAIAATDGVFTPQVNLIFNDSIWRGGAGVLNTYSSESGGQGSWTGFYWQFIAGINLPLKKVDLDLLAFYPFQNWQALQGFDFKDIEFGLWLNFNL